MERRRLILIGIASEALRESLRQYFEAEIEGSAVFVAGDGTDLLLKASRTKPNLVVLSSDLPKTAPEQIYLALRQKFPRDRIAYLYLGAHLPEDLKDPHSLGEVIWCPTTEGPGLSEAIAQALNATGEISSHYRVHHLAKAEVLLREGEDPAFLYFVLRGSLVAVTKRNGENILLGNIGPGEFVGEMAVLNSEKRTATVVAQENCQLLEIPAADFNRVVLAKPSWAKALMTTLTKRLKFMNALSKRFD